MIEKVFEKSYPPTVSKQTLSRLAKRFIKEYKESNEISSDDFLPEEIKQAAQNIKEYKEVEFTDYEYTNTLSSTGTGFRAYDTVKRESEYHYSASYDRDEYGDYVFYVSWYFFSNDRYTKTINGKKYADNNSMSLYKKVYAALGKYRYFCTHRPPTRGCIPEGFIHYETYQNGSRYIGQVTYDVKPNDDELYKWGLVFDKEYEQERAAYMSYLEVEE